MNGTDSCSVCECSDMMKDCGSYYFQDGQKQLEEIRHQVFDAGIVEEKDAEKEIEQITSQVLGRKTKKQRSADRKGEDFTSWEMFNFVLRGQVEELVALGAPPSIRMTVLQLWAYYLKKLNAAFISKEKTVLPNTDVGVLKRDAKLAFGVNDEMMKLRKTNNTHTKGINASLSESQDLSSMKVKKLTRSQMKKEVTAKQIESSIVDNQGNHSCYLGESTIGNDTVTADEDLNSSQKVLEGDISLLANAQLYKENEDKISRNDIFINNFRLSINHLTRQKLIMLLYLALLYEGSDICLSDIIRWIREGHLSYFEVVHFLPESCFQKGKSPTQFRIVYELPSYESLRLGSYCLADFLGMVDWPLPIWSTIAKKYVLELQLPVTFCDVIQQLINLAPNVFNNKSFGGELPCYEGRILAIIMIIMKIVFGLDGKTERKISKVASKLNVWPSHKRRKHRKKLFVWCKWVKQLICRNAILAEHHFPTKHVICPETFGNSNSYINILKKKEKDNIKTRHNYQYQKSFLSDTHPALINLFNNILEQLDNPEMMEKDDVDFPACTNPYYLYTVQILEKSMEVDNLVTTKAREILTEDFSDSDVSYLFHPSSMRKLVEEKGHHFKTDVKSAQKKFCVNNSSQNKRYCEGSFKRPCFVAVTKCRRQCINGRNGRKNEPKDRLFVEIKEENKRVSLHMKQIMSKALSFVLGRKRKKSGFKYNLRKRKQENEHLKHKTLKLYLPHQQYWVLHEERCTSEKEFESQIFVKLPFAFAWFLSECALLSEMKKFDLYKELVFMEKYYKDHVCS